MAAKYLIVRNGDLTRIYDPDGKEMRNVKSVVIKQNAGEPMFAEITLIAIGPDVSVCPEVTDVR